MRRTVFFVAPLPPPVTGYSLVSERMLGALAGSGEVVVADRAPSSAPGPLRHVRDGLTLLGQLLHLLSRCVRRKHDALYVALSGGWRQIGDLAFLLLARAGGGPTAIHHHSFNYLLRPTRLSRLLLGFGRKSLHLALCEAMKRELVEVYDIPSEQILVLPNAAFVDGSGATAQARAPGGPLVLGFLSNITAEKGIFVYFDLIERCLESGLAVEGRVAGPVDPSIKERFEERLGRIPAVAHLGPVYGAEKRAFLEAIDMLVFPSLYPNEASPVTILEAAAAGVPTLGTRRGCIPEMLDRLGGDALPESDFVAEAHRRLEQQMRSPEELGRLGSAVAARFRDLRAGAEADLSDLAMRLRS